MYKLLFRLKKLYLKIESHYLQIQHNHFQALFEKRLFRDVLVFTSNTFLRAIL